MKLEYLPDGSSDCPLLRLYEFNHADVTRLIGLVRSRIVGDCQSIMLHDELWMESVGKCRLTLQLGKRNQGIREILPVHFECVLTPDGWRNVEGLLEPFCNSSATGFQWLTHNRPFSLLISKSGQW
jgi:hypothetical protein